MQQNAQNASSTLLRSVLAAVTKYHGLTALYRNFLQLWRLEVCNQGASRARSGESSLLGLQTATFLFYLHVAKNMAWTE